MCKQGMQLPNSWAWDDRLGDHGSFCHYCTPCWCAGHKSSIIPALLMADAALDCNALLIGPSMIQTSCLIWSLATPPGRIAPSFSIASIKTTWASWQFRFLFLFLNLRIFNFTWGLRSGARKSVKGASLVPEFLAWVENSWRRRKGCMWPALLRCPWPPPFFHQWSKGFYLATKSSFFFVRRPRSHWIRPEWTA